MLKILCLCFCGHSVERKEVRNNVVNTHLEIVANPA